MSMLLGDKQRAPPLNNRNCGSSGPAVSSGLIWVLGGGNDTSLREETQNRLQRVVMNFFPQAHLWSSTKHWSGCVLFLCETRVQEIQPTAA